MKKVNYLLIGILPTIVFGLLMSMIPAKNTESVFPEDQSGFKSIFDGKSLDGWKGDPTYWSVQDGAIVGLITPETLLKANTFLIWQGGQPGDFELKAKFRISESGNSGINYRSDMVEDVPYALKGYQADIDGKINYTGQNYEERKRTTLAYRGQKTKITPQPSPNGNLRDYVERNAWKGLHVTEELGDRDELKKKINFEGWNDIHIVAKGNVLKHYVNGILMSEVVDDDPANFSAKGFLGVQVHVGPPMKVEYKDLLLKMD
ncbi:3-keto-disaccharide hydrolase [Algoriphagus machipongonensis]|uniref:Probable secreted glycosyl hydrolase n=1 Tax=Algoriphagus machipongonensis TaxID=388413 RepID=A3HYW7_9BACT|nr:probable secreted glycosyl hydrolase [Algoriphagus machipongonensis]